MNQLPLLPTGQQDFEELRKLKMLYVDKTDYIHRILRTHTPFFFLSRPRRFGKSLLISTLKTIFEGKKHLFEGLYIYDKIEWNEYPVLHFDFSKMDFRGKGLNKSIFDRLTEIAITNEITFKESTIGSMFAELMQKLHQKTGRQVVILIDEYDKPITDVLEVGKNQKTYEHRDILRMFYSVVKGNSAHIRFFFMTGIARFSKVSLFSDLNNLTDLSLEKDYHNLLGYTQIELESYFESHLNFIAKERQVSIEKLLEEIKEWYNGFSWNGQEKLYNPYSILRFLFAREFRNFWFDSGTPKFLIELSKDRLIYDMSGIIADSTETENFDIERLGLVTLFFQTGYLTIKSVDDLGSYVLDYPNKEVELSMVQHNLIGFAETTRGSTLAKDLIRAIRSHNIEKFIETVNVLFASIPYQIFDQHQEKYFHAILFLSLKLCGFFIESEVSVSTGRLDAVMRYQNRTYLFEFKLNDSAQNAIQQMKNKGYYKSYITKSNQEIYLLGIGFSGKTKSVADWKIEQM